MALETVGDLRAAVKRQSHRNDIDDDQVNDFIDQCESDIYANEFDILRVREMETRSTAVTAADSRYLELPDNFLEMRRLSLLLGSGETPDVTFQAPNQLRVKSSGRPKFFTVTSQLEFDRIPDSTYSIEMQHMVSAVPLTDDAPTNFVLSNYPNIYLYGSLWALFLWTMDEQRATYYRGLFLGSIRGANKGTKKSRYGPSPSLSQNYGSTP